MNAFQIDFSLQSKKDIEIICDRYSIKFDELMEKHKVWDFYKIFIDIESFKMFAYILNSDRKTLKFTDAIDEVILSIKPEVVEVKEETPTSEIILDIDTILEKITNYGINSLTNKEKEFLDNSSKS
jgi:hypothetical protein